MSHTLEFLVDHGYALIFASVLVEEIGLPMPSGPVLLAAGALVGFHRLSLAAVVGTAFAATLLADCILFFLGRRRGNSVLAFVCRVSLEPDTCISKSRSLYQRYGPKSLLISKFVPWVGTLGPPMAGLFGLAPAKFLVIDAVGALLWSGTYFAAGWIFRWQLEDLVAALSRFGGWAGAAVIAVLAAYLLWKLIKRRRIYRSLRANRITAHELKQKMDSGEALLVVDLRIEIERREGLIPGAIAVSEKNLAELETVAGAREVIFYCSCPDEITSVRAALRLKRHGVDRVHPLLGGFQAWRDLGFPVQVAEAGGQSIGRPV